MNLRDLAASTDAQIGRLMSRLQALETSSAQHFQIDTPIPAHEDHRLRQYVDEIERLARVTETSASELAAHDIALSTLLEQVGKLLDQTERDAAPTVQCVRPARLGPPAESNANTREQDVSRQLTWAEAYPGLAQPQGAQQTAPSQQLPAVTPIVAPVQAHAPAAPMPQAQCPPGNPWGAYAHGGQEWPAWLAWYRKLSRVSLTPRQCLQKEATSEAHMKGLRLSLAMNREGVAHPQSKCLTEPIQAAHSKV